MKKEEISGVEYIHHDNNPFFENVKNIEFNLKNATLEVIKKLPNVYLHPCLKPIENIVFAVMCPDADTFHKFYDFEVEHKATRKAFRVYENTFHIRLVSCIDLINKYIKEFKPWYDEKDS